MHRQHLADLLLPLILAAFGGLVRCLTQQRKITGTRILTEITAAIFAGLIIHYLTLSFDVAENIRIVCVSLAGYSSQGVLKIFSAKFLDKLREL